MVHADLF